MTMTLLEQYLQDNIRKVQLKELEILSCIHDICIKNKIDYWLDGGTCLGAVRHKGFIPWDDDIDIAMRMEDIDRFCEAAKKELPKHLFLQTKDTDPSCRFPIIKVRDFNSFAVEYGDDFTRPYQKGLFVDIFPMMPYPSVSKAKCKKITQGYCKSNAILMAQHVYSWRAVAELFYFGLKKIMYKLWWNILCRTKSMNTYYGNRIQDNGYGVIHRKDSIFPIKEIDFEGRRFMAPANPDAYLKDLYKDYMQLPPDDKRKGHAVFFAAELLK